MELIRNVSLIIFGLVAVALVISNYLPLFRDMMKDKGRKTTEHNITVGQGLEILKSSTDSLSKAKAFVSLMDLSYVLVHTLVNKGNNYDDEIQNKRFHKFLTPQVMKEIVGVEGVSMNNVHSEFVRADLILKDFAKTNDKFVQRFESLLEDINIFIKEADLKGKVIVNELALGYMLVDYFEDIRRLKTFHGIDHVNSIKIVAYTSYWFLRRKPIQIIEQEKELIYINERFVLAYILEFLSGNYEPPLILRDNKGLKSFSESLFYFLKYRVNGANSLEMILTAFFAGQIFQERDKDLSDILAKYV